MKDLTVLPLKVKKVQQTCSVAAVGQQKFATRLGREAVVE